MHSRRPRSTAGPICRPHRRCPTHPGKRSRSDRPRHRTTSPPDRRTVRAAPARQPGRVDRRSLRNQAGGRPPATLGSTPRCRRCGRASGRARFRPGSRPRRRAVASPSHRRRARIRDGPRVPTPQRRLSVTGPRNHPTAGNPPHLCRAPIRQRGRARARRHRPPRRRPAPTRQPGPAPHHRLPPARPTRRGKEVTFRPARVRRRPRGTRASRPTTGRGTIRPRPAAKARLSVATARSGRREATRLPRPRRQAWSPVTGPLREPPGPRRRPRHSPRTRASRHRRAVDPPSVNRGRPPSVLMSCPRGPMPVRSRRRPGTPRHRVGTISPRRRPIPPPAPRGRRPGSPDHGPRTPRHPRRVRRAVSHHCPTRPRPTSGRTRVKPARNHHHRRTTSGACRHTARTVRRPGSVTPRRSRQAAPAHPDFPLRRTRLRYRVFRRPPTRRRNSEPRRTRGRRIAALPERLPLHPRPVRTPDRAGSVRCRPYPATPLPRVARLCSRPKPPDSPQRPRRRIRSDRNRIPAPRRRVGPPPL